MPRLKASNHGATTITAAIDAIQTSFVVADASSFPDAPFRITIDAEIMEVGAIDRETNTFSNITRGVEGTESAPHEAQAVVTNRFTAGTFNELIDNTNLSQYAVQLGSGNQDVNLIKALMHEIHTRSAVLTYTSGMLTKVEEKDGETVVRTINLSWDGARLSQAELIAGGKTTTLTFNYDVDGTLASMSRSVT